MSCLDCKGGTPTSAWKRCEECALEYMRVHFFGKPPTKAARRYARGSRVHVNGEINRPGKIVRAKDDAYTIELDGGGRCYVSASQLSDVSPG